MTPIASFPFSLLKELSNHSKPVEEFAKFEWWRVSTFSYDRSVSAFMSLKCLYVRNLSFICPYITKTLKRTRWHPGMMVSLLVFRKPVFFLHAHCKQGSRFLSEVQKSIFSPWKMHILNTWVKAPFHLTLDRFLEKPSTWCLFFLQLLHCKKMHTPDA